MPSGSGLARSRSQVLLQRRAVKLDLSGQLFPSVSGSVDHFQSRPSSRISPWGKLTFGRDQSPSASTVERTTAGFSSSTCDHARRPWSIARRSTPPYSLRARSGLGACAPAPRGGRRAARRLRRSAGRACTPRGRARARSPPALRGARRRRSRRSGTRHSRRVSIAPARPRSSARSRLTSSFPPRTLMLPSIRLEGCTAPRCRPVSSAGARPGGLGVTERRPSSRHSQRGAVIQTSLSAVNPWGSAEHHTFGGTKGHQDRGDASCEMR